MCDNMIEISYNKIKENILAFDLETYLVLKSNAYGFGFRKILDIAIEASIYKFCVIDLMDAIYIKEKYPFARVLLLGVFDETQIYIYQRYDIEISINDLSDLDFLNISNLKVQLKINSGMNRYGISPEDIGRVLSIIDDKKLTLMGIYSHNATSNLRTIKEQKEAFFYAVKCVKNIDIHYAASGLMDDDFSIFNCKRIGANIYKDSLSVYGKIVKINYVFKDEYIGYDYSYKMENDGYIGIIDIGYADGLERNCSGFLVYINNRYYHLVGKACMNCCFVLIDEYINVLDKVHFISIYNPILNYERFFGKIKHEIYLRFLSK